MASSEKHLTRRQRQRQHKQQPVLGRQEVARTSTDRFGSSLPRKAGWRRLRLTQRQWQRFQGQSRLNWLRRLFGKSVSLSLPEKKPPVRSRRADRPAVKLSPPEKPPSQPASGSKVEQISAPRRRRQSGVKPSRDVDTPPQKLSPGDTSPPRRRQSQIRSSGTNKSSTESPERSTRSKLTAVRPLGKPKRGASYPLIYGTRLLILGIGLGVVVGTLLSIGNPTSHTRPSASPTNQSSQIKKAVASESLPDAPATSELQISSQQGEEIAPLKAEITAALEQYPQLTPAVFILDPDTDAYFDWNGTSAIPSASTIKIPILVAFFQDVDAGKIRLDELLTMKAKFIATGSGNMQHKFPGSRYTAWETATKMITISDNTATNMLIERLGGEEALNQRFLSWGLTATAIRNQLPDVEGTNTTSAKDLATLIAFVNQGDLLSKQSRDRLLSILRRTERNHLLPRGLGPGATIAHKTGYIGAMLADAGLIELPNRKRYIAAVMVKRPHNDPRAEKLIRQISRIAYQHFSRKQTASPPTVSEPTASADNSIISPIEQLGNSPSTVARRQLQLGRND
ncbi:serine hydrolase [Microseira sp. BLCC-F43]|uniref:serine hydrolase n=1 Tax=Microseira sp. BLCC-F43 TaxID=3153602 RepID=UPI0035BB0A0E